MTRKLVVVGSTKLSPSMPMISKITAMFSEYPDDTLAVRMSRDAAIPGSIVEQTALLIWLNGKIGGYTERDIEFYRPNPDEGKAAVFNRDIRMVEDADFVAAFFAEGEVMTGGTAHVVTCAINGGHRVEAYAVDQEGDVRLIGSSDLEPVWRA